MSKVVDERVVSMQFDNKHFESNVQTTMSTLDKLKAKLNFKDAGRSFENINAAATKCNLSPLSNAVDTVGIRFNAMYTIADQALRNITNSAMAAGKRIVSALTVDPVKTGFSEYETKINAVQVIKANTRGKYDTEEAQMNAIYDALGRLNEYADRTIYNFAQMTDNVGKFVAQTGDVEKSVKAVEGLANLAGASGASANDMARATYQMSQSIGGVLRKIDWNSLVNSNMAGLELQNMLTDLAKIRGIDVDSLIDSKGTFADTLEEGWLTGDLFMEAMNIYSDAYSEAELAAMGFNEEQVKNFKDLAKTAREATTEVKTWTQMWDVLKETAQSGWTQTWELIIGDFDSAKALLSPLAKFFMEFIDRMSDARNTILQGALDFATPWKKIMAKLEGAGLGKIKDVIDNIENAADKLKYFQDVVNQVWHGDYKNADTGRYDLLEAAGYDHRVVQDLVNKGLDYKLTIEDVEASHKKFGLTMATTSENAETMTDVLANLTDKELENAGLTEDEISLFRALAKEADKAGISIGELADRMSKADGRTLLIDSFKNAGKGILEVASVIRSAWEDIFNPPTTGETIVKLYGIITAINDFSKRLTIVNSETGELTELGDKLSRIFKGLFAAIDIVARVTGGALRLAFKVVSGLLDYFGMDMLEIVAMVGDAVVAFRDWINEISLIDKAATKIVEFLVKSGRAFRDWIAEIGLLDNATSKITDFINEFKSWISGIKEAENIPEYIARGIISGISTVVKAIFELGKSLLLGIMGVLGIQSPSTEFFEIGTYIIQGLVNGLVAGGSLVWNTVKDIGSKALDAIKSIDYNKLISIIVLGGVLVGFLKIANAIKNFSKPFEAAGEVLDETTEVVEGVAQTVKNFAKVVKSYSGLLKAKAVKELAIAIGIIVGAVALLSFLKPEKLWPAVAAVGVLAVVLVGMSFAISLLNKIPSVDFGKTSLVILSVSLAAVLMASALKKLESLDPNKWKQTVSSFAVAIGALGVLITAIGLAFGLTKLDISKVSPILFKLTAAMTAFVILCKVLGSMDPNEAQQGAQALTWLSVLMGALMGFTAIASVYLKVAGANAGELGSAMLKMSGSLLILAGVVKILSTMTDVELGRGYGVLLGLTGIIALLSSITKLIGKNDFSALGSSLLKMSVAMAIMLGLIAVVGKIPQADFDRGYAALFGLVGIIALLTLVTKLIGTNDFSKMGGTLLKLSVAMAILALVTKAVGNMPSNEFDKGYAALFGLSALIALLVGITRIAGGNDLTKVGSTVMAMSVSMMILAGACALLSVFNQNGGVTSAANALILMAMAMTLMMLATKDMKDCKGNIIAMTAAIVAISVALAAMSFIAASDPASLGIAAACIAGLMIVFGLMAKLTSKTDVKITPLIVMTAAVGVLAGMLYLLASLPDPGKTLAAAGSLSVTMLALAGALAIAGKFGSTGAGLGLLAASAGILAISAALWVLAGIPFPQLALGIGAVVVALLAIVGAAALLTILGAGAAILTGVLLSFSAAILAVGVGMLAFSASLYVAGLALPLLGEGFALLGEGLKTFITTVTSCREDAGAFMVTMLSLAGGITVFSLALVVAAAGVILFSAGLVVLAAAVLIASVGALGFAGALYIVGLALPLIANGLTALGVGIQNFVTSVAACENSMDSFSTVMSALGTSILEFSLKLAGGFAVVALAAIALGAGAVVLAAGLVVLGASVIVVATGILALSLAFVTLGAGASFAGLGIIVLGASIAAAIDLVVGAVFNIGEQAKTAGTNLVQGFANGITSAIETVKSAVGGFVSSCVSTICELLGIESPSKVAYTLGTYTGDGFALGLDDSTEKVNASATNLANSAQTSMETAGTEGSTSFMDSLGEGIDLSSIDIGSLNMQSITSSLGGAGAAGGTSFITGLTDKLGTSSIDVSSLNLSSLTSSFGNVGKESGSSFISSFGSSLDMSSLDLGSMDMSSITSMFGKSGSDAGASFAEGVNSTTDSATLKPSVDKMLEEVNSSKSDFRQAGINLVTAFTTGVTNSAGVIKNKAALMANSIVTTLSNKSPSFYGAGASMAQGFANGISDNAYKAAAKAKAMAEAAVEAAREALDINSPSKVFMRLGSSIPEGFAKGIGKFGHEIEESSVNMAKVAMDGTRYAIARIAETINTDIDSQPTIRPVLDLSGVKSGANTINSLFGMQPSLDLLTNVGSISTMMNGRQNEINTTNDDVVAAIKDLKTAIRESSGDSYSIGGITYDDGSNIADTIRSLVRASRIEGRI